MPKGKKKKQKEPQAPEPETKEQDTDEEPSPPPGVVDITAVPVWQIIPVFINVFDRVAWQKMGLVVNPQSQKIEKDMNQAQAAIDCYDALLTHLGDNIDPETKKLLQTRLTDLKLNFAQQA